MSKSKKTDLAAIQTIDPRIYAIGKKNGLKTRDIAFTQSYIKNKFNASEAYRQTINPNTTIKTVTVQSSLKVANPSIKKTIEEILIDNEITPENTLEKHKEIREKALKKQDYTNARECNRDFLKILKVLDNKAETSDNKLVINNAVIDINAIDKLISLKKQL